MSKFNTKESTKTTNLAGGVAYEMGSEMELVHAVLSTFLENKFYESGDERIERICQLVATNKPEFVARLAKVARTEFHMRSVSHVLIGELAKTHKGDDLVKRTIVACALRPDDLTEICAYVGTPLPKQVKRGVRNALLKFNRYQLAKYRGEGKKWSLVDLFNMTHPKPQHANEEQKKAWKDLMSGDLQSFDTWEVESSRKADAKTWEDLVLEGKLGYMALIRNLNNLIKHNVSKEAQLAAVAKLTDADEVRRSKQLPFRFYTAYKNVTGNRLFSDAISEAMDLAVSNVPKLEGKTLIAVDTSGSMTGDPIEKAAIFGATLLKANVDADVVLYDTEIEEFSGSGRTPVADLADRIIHDAMGGGTETSLVFSYATGSQTKYDRIIIISDSESWAEGWSMVDSVQSAYEAYRKKTGSDPMVYAIDIQGYGTKDVTGGRVFHLAGWSSRLLDFIGQVERGNELVDYIKGVELAAG